MLTAGELAELRTDFSAVLSDSVVRVRFTYIENERGNQVRDTENRLTIAALIQQTDGTEVTVGQDTAVSNWELTCSWDADVDSRDVIEAYGKDFEVLGPPSTRPSQVEGVLKKARLRHIG